MLTFLAGTVLPLPPYSTTSTVHGSFHPWAPGPESHCRANVLAINRLNKKWTTCCPSESQDQSLRSEPTWKKIAHFVRIFIRNEVLNRLAPGTAWQSKQLRVTKQQIIGSAK
jgi:hypothetical protein